MLSMVCFIFPYFAPLRLHSFPTRRSSDLAEALKPEIEALNARAETFATAADVSRLRDSVVSALSDKLATLQPPPGDRKSTRLNSSHVETSYAVFCLKINKEGRVM